VLLVTDVSAAQRPLAVLPSQIDSIVAAHQAKNLVPTVGLHLGSTNGLALYEKTYFDGRIFPRGAADGKTRFLLASVSKPYSSAVVHRLAEQGLIDLAAPIGRYLTELPKWRDSITVRQLLSHSSGITDYTDVTGWADSVLASDYIDRALLSPLLFAPGTRMQYSNTNFAVVQRLVERVAARPFREVLKELVLQPLQLTETSLDCLEGESLRRAQGHRIGRGNVLRPVPLPPIGHNNEAAAGLCATAGDVALFFSSVLAGRLLAAASIADLHAAPPQNGNGVSSGAGLFVSHETTGEVWHHGGALPSGFNNEVAVWPRDSLLVVVLTNSLDGEAERLTRDIARSLLRIAVPTPLKLPITQDALGRYVGRYVTHDGRMIVTLVDQRLHVMGQPCSYQGEDTFVCDPGQARTVRFVRDRSGDLEAWLLVEGTRRIVGVRRP
jgi:CubicO group peptidase (beta-lactamase class C family)